MAKPSVIIENVSKKFSMSFRNALKYGLVDSLRRTVGIGKNTTLRSGEFWALKDIHLELQPGDALGIMGVNGSGKTTLLRILNGTYTPDSGKVTLRGRVGALVAAGAGFSPMLTGRENVLISGTILGMTPNEIRKKFDEIVAFADLGEFIDMPVRNYSSGMAVRLGFAVAVLGKPDILLVDEVLAVGDLSFQKKCFERIFQLRQQGTTILLVSHSSGAIWVVCNKGLLLHQGRQTLCSSVEELVRLYDDRSFSALDNSFNATGKSTPSEYGHAVGGTGDAAYGEIRILDNANAPRRNFTCGEQIVIEADVIVNKKIHEPLFRFGFDTSSLKQIAVIDSYEQGTEVPVLDPGTYRLAFKFSSRVFRPGFFSLNAAIASRKLGVHIYYRFSCGAFTVNHPQDRFFYACAVSAMNIDSTVELSKV